MTITIERSHKTIYASGISENGKPLIAGIWRHHRQNGFPVDISLIHIRDEMQADADLLEAMAEAAIYNELHVFVSHAGAAITDEVKGEFMFALRQRGYPDRDEYEICREILDEKRNNALTFALAS